MSEYRLPSHVRYRVVADEAVVLRLTEGKVLGLNWTGTRIFELFHRGASQQEVVEQLSQEVEAEPEELAADIAAFAEELLAAGVLEVASS